MSDAQSYHIGDWMKSKQMEQRGGQRAMDEKKPDLNSKLFGQDLFGEHLAPKVEGALKKRFLIPPFSVLNAREGAWQERKRAWIALGIKSELGRGGNQLDMSAASVGITDEREREMERSKAFKSQGKLAKIQQSISNRRAEPSRAEPSRHKPLTWGITPNGMSTTKRKAYTEAAKKKLRPEAAKDQPVITANDNAATAQEDQSHE